MVEEVVRELGARGIERGSSRGGEFRPARASGASSVELCSRRKKGPSEEVKMDLDAGARKRLLCTTRQRRHGRLGWPARGHGVDHGVSRGMLCSMTRDRSEASRAQNLTEFDSTRTY